MSISPPPLFLKKCKIDKVVNAAPLSVQQPSKSNDPTPSLVIGDILVVVGLGRDREHSCVTGDIIARLRSAFLDHQHQRCLREVL